MAAAAAADEPGAGLRAFVQHVQELKTAKYVAEKSGGDSSAEENVVLETGNGFDREYTELKHMSDEYKTMEDYKAAAGALPENKKKNRYKDILPYDYARVLLDGESNYINASYIKGVGDTCTHIASQGPLPATVIDFWRMIYLHNTQVIVMATRTFELGKHKCAQYWPEIEDAPEYYGTFKVTTVKIEEVCEDFRLHRLVLEFGGETRPIAHFQYHTWPDHGVPDSAAPLLQLLAMARECQAALSPPILVHCSAGCGRTGVIIALDIAWLHLKSEGLAATFDVRQLVGRLRQQRPAMVQTRDQYIFVYKTLLDLVRVVLDSVRQEQPPDQPTEGIYEIVARRAKDPVRITDEPLYMNMSLDERMKSLVNIQVPSVDAELHRLSPEPEPLELNDIDDHGALPTPPSFSRHQSTSQLSSSSSESSGPPLPTRGYTAPTPPDIATHTSTSGSGSGSAGVAVLAMNATVSASTTDPPRMTEDEIKSLYAVPHKLHRGTAIAGATSPGGSSTNINPFTSSSSSSGVGGGEGVVYASVAVRPAEPRFTDDYACIDELQEELAASGQRPSEPARMLSISLGNDQSANLRGGEPWDPLSMVFPNRVRHPRGPRPIPPHLANAQPSIPHRS